MGRYGTDLAIGTLFQEKASAKRIAKQLCYPKHVLNSIEKAVSVAEVQRVLHDARLSY